MKTIDIDSHLYEARDMWATYADPAQRDLAVRIVDDALGYGVLSYQGRSPRGAYCWISEPTKPGDPKRWEDFLGGPQQRQRDGLPAEMSYSDVPAEYHDPSARVALLDKWGVDESILFPNWGMEFEGLFFERDLAGLQANLVAWNRWASEVREQGDGRLHPVGHLTVQGDPAWALKQLAFLDSKGIRLAVVTPGLINGIRPSHPDNDVLWRAFVEHDITLTFHTNVGTPSLVPSAWTENDHGTFSLLGETWKNVAVQIMLSDLVLNGVLERHPALRVAIIEHRATQWVADLMQRMDHRYDLQPRTAGWRVSELSLRPSDYVRRQCRFSVLADEPVRAACERVGDLFGFSADFPHVEGVPDPLQDFRSEVELPTPASEELLYSGNAAWVLHRTAV